MEKKFNLTFYHLKVDSPDASVKLIDANEFIESTENVLPNVNYMGVDAPPPPYLIYGYYVNQLPPLIAPIISNSVPAPESVELTESKDNKQKQFLQKKRKRKIRSTLNISNNVSVSAILPKTYSHIVPALSELNLRLFGR